MRIAMIIMALGGVAAIAYADPPSHAEWELTFADEFDGDTVDWELWESQASSRGADRLEARWPENNELRDGILHQTTKRENPPRGDKDWSTAHIWTREFTQQYGYFECRLRYGRYLNNAFWLVRPRGKFDRPHFEIDVNEGHTPSDIAMCHHHYFYFEGDDESEHVAAGKVWQAPEDLEQDFHIYACEWDAERIVWYFDGRPIRTLINPGADAPVDVRLSTIIKPAQLERDGVDVATMDGVAMSVDWVRVYRKARDLHEPEGLPEAETMLAPTIVETDPQVNPEGQRAVILDQDFDAARVGALPEGWQVGEGQPAVVKPDKPALDNSVQLLRLRANDYVFAMFDEPVTDRLEIEFDCYQPKQQSGLLLVTLGDFDATAPKARATSYYTGDIGPYIHWNARFLRWYTEDAKWNRFARMLGGRWRHLRFLLDIPAGVFDCYEGDEFIGGGPFRHAQPAALGIGIRNRGDAQPISVDNVVVRTVVAQATDAKEDDATVDAQVNPTTETPAPPEGEIIWEADLTDTSGWKWDGEGSAEHLDDGALRVNNTTRSVYWADHVFNAPVLFDYEVRTDDEKCRAILFFMAEGIGGEDIFGWERPAADYGDYAYVGTMRLYTVGMMREGLGTENNFRFLGGELPEHLQILKTPPAELTDEQKPLYKQAFADFQPYSIPSTAMDNYVRGQWQRYQALVDGNLIRVWADGRLLHEVTDSDPLPSGRVGLRNFMANTAIEIRNLRALRPLAANE